MALIFQDDGLSLFMLMMFVTRDKIVRINAAEMKVFLNYGTCGGDKVYLQALTNKYGLEHHPDASVEMSYNDDIVKVMYAGSKINVDFASGQLQWRRYHGGGEAIAKAVGVKSTYHPYVLDSTGGFGTDAFILASHGCRVKLFERHPLVACLLEDGVRRATNQFGSDFSENFSFNYGDSWEYLKNLSSYKANTSALNGNPSDDQLPDVIYLDPMFPKTKNSALVKKNLKFLQTLLPLDPENDERLIQIALRTARKRVVVKRPLDAPCLGNFKTANFVKSNRYRFDIYSTIKKK